MTLKQRGHLKDMLLGKHLSWPAPQHASQQSSTGEDEAISLWWEPAFWLARCRRWLLICLQGFPALAGAYTLGDLHIHLHIEIPPI